MIEKLGFKGISILVYCQPVEISTNQESTPLSFEYERVIRESWIY